MKEAYLDTALKSAAFPVLVADESGTVLDKNRAAERLLPSIRRRCDLIRRLKGRPTLCGGSTVALRESSPYFRALVLSDGDRLLLLFLARLQYPDGERVAHEIVRKTGGKLPFDAENESPTEPCEAKASRLCRALLHVGIPEDNGISEGFPFDRLWNEIASHVGGGFRALGYRVTMEKAEPCPAERLISLSPCGFSYLVGTLLLLLMKHSENGILTLKAPFYGEDRTRRLLFSTRTALSERAVNGIDTVTLLSRLAPEYTAELSLLPHTAEALRGVRAFVDSYGKLCIEYTLPYSNIPAALNLRSTGKRTAYRNAAAPLFALLGASAKRR